MLAPYPRQCRKNTNTLSRFDFLTLGLVVVMFVVLGIESNAVAQSLPASRLPNIVIMMADDLGFGELQCLNPTRGKIRTPCLDAIAANGMVFSDAHSGSSVCSPTRYGLLTGRYAWRTRLQSGVLTGGESLIAKDRLTIAKMLRGRGYHTCVVGKWHLGMLFDGKHQTGDVPVGNRVTDGPLDRGGFDEFHGYHHAGQIQVWVDNDQVTGAVEPVEMLPRLTQAAVDYIDGREGKDQPFFLFVPWSAPHSPVAPAHEWQGESGLNAHADFVMQTDDSFGQVIKALERNGLTKNTLVICTSDNGTSAPTANIPRLQSLGHFSSGDLRGSKADIWDGGHRVPFLVSWPTKVQPGSRCDDLVCLTDVFATLAEILAFEIPETAAEDSFSFYSALTGKHVARDHVIHHSNLGYFAIRHGDWKLACCPGSGGWSKPKPSIAFWSETQSAGRPMVQLYDMRHDIGEQNNLVADQPEKVLELRAILDRIIAQGRSTPGANKANDTKIVVDKPPLETKRK